MQVPLGAHATIFSMQAASVVQAYPLVSTIFGIVFFREFRGVSRFARLLLAAQASPLV